MQSEIANEHEIAEFIELVQTLPKEKICEVLNMLNKVSCQMQHEPPPK